MSDPLSISAGIAGLLAFTGSTVSTCYSYGCLLKDGPEEVRKLVEEMLSIAGVLNAVKALVDQTLESTLQEATLSSDGAALALAAPPPPYSTAEARIHFQQLTEPIHGTENVLRDVQDALRKADIYQEQNKLGRLVKRLRWPLKRDHTLEVVHRLERYKNLFMMALDTMNLSVTMDMQRTLEDVRQLQITERLERQIAEKTTELRRSFQWLCPVNFTEAHRDARQLYLQGTGSWILQLPEWQSWMQRDRAFLWLYGIPGSGKTVMTSTLIETCLGMYEDKRAHVAYFYCDFRNKDSQRPEIVLGGLINQFCAQITVPVPELDQFAKDHRTHGEEFNKPTFDELRHLLFVVLGYTERAVIVIDALDECTERSVLLDLLTALPKYQDSHVKVLVSSRQEGDIEAALAPFERLSTRVDAQKADIEFYVSNGMASRPRLARLHPELQTLVHSTLVDSAQGMFRWVQCQLDALSRLHTDRDIRRTVRQLPSTLYATYERILARIDTADRPTARRALIWLACAPRQLDISELTEAVAIDDDMTSRDAEAIWVPADLLSVIGSLARYSPMTRRIELAHHSVKEFLASNAVEAEFYIDPAAGRAELAERMLRYLLMTDFAAPCGKRSSFIERLENYPLFYLAARYWPLYARDALMEGTNTRVFDLAARLLTVTPNGNFWSWMEVLIAQGPLSYSQLKQQDSPFENSDKDNEKGFRFLRSHPNCIPVPTNLHPLYYAASFGLTPLVSHLLKSGADVNAAGGRFLGTALHAAVFRDHTDVVVLLLSAGADTGIKDGTGELVWTLADLAGAGDETQDALHEAGACIMECRERHPRDFRAWWDLERKRERKMLHRESDVRGEEKEKGERV